MCLSKLSPGRKLNYVKGKSGPMTLMGRALVVSLPDTVLEERDTLRDKTMKLGTISRTCAIYGVDEIEIYADPTGRGEGAFIQQVLEYLETPQYLRKRLFPLDESLRFVGLLPPLRIPSHKAKVPLDKIAVGEVKEGVTNPDGTVDIGLDARPRLKERLAPNKRVTVRVASKSPFSVEVTGREEIPDYWGYRVERKKVQDVFADKGFGLTIAASRLGKPFHGQAGPLGNAVRKARGIKLVFGPPSKGLYDIVGPSLDDKADFVLNLFPEQHVETVRTEEALFAGLALVQLMAAVPSSQS